VAPPNDAAKSAAELELCRLRDGGAVSAGLPARFAASAAAAEEPAALVGP